jgi:hypothetical protein
MAARRSTAWFMVSLASSVLSTDGDAVAVPCAHTSRLVASTGAPARPSRSTDSLAARA